jgi:hypothetical protein
MSLTAPCFRLAAFRRFFLIALAASTVMTLATIMLFHSSDTPVSISLNAPMAAKPKMLTQPSLTTPKARPKATSNVTSLYSGSLSVRLLAQEALATHLFDILFDGVFQIQILYEASGAQPAQPMRMHVLVNYIHCMELRDVVVASAASPGWWTVGSTALPAGNVRISVQRIDSNAGSHVVLNGIHTNYIGAGRFLGGEDCVSSESARYRLQQSPLEPTLVSPSRCRARASLSTPPVLVLPVLVRSLLRHRGPLHAPVHWLVQC